MSETIQMQSIQNIIYPADLIRMSKETLEKICTNMGITSDGHINMLVGRIWEHIENDQVAQREVLEFCKNQLLCPIKTSVSWFRLNHHLLTDTDTPNLQGARERIVKYCTENHGFNPFESKHNPNPNSITNPVLIGGAIGDNPNEYYLRFIYTAGYSRHNGIRMEIRPIIKLATVYFQEDSDFVEVRTDSKKARDVIASLSQILGPEDYSFSKVNITEHHDNELAAIADNLGGTLYNTDSRLFDPLDLQDLELNSIVEVLEALNEYFKKGNTDELLEQLEKVRENLGEDTFVATPFTALMIAGLRGIGLNVDKTQDVRGTPFYSLVSPNVETVGGLIQFPFTEGGREEKYRIQVGLHSQSILFQTAATENVIRYVRERVVFIR